MSFIGGGSDMPEYYQTNGPGRVVSMAIDKHIYVVVKLHTHIFGERYRISYSKNEITNSIDEIENNVIRECIRFSGIEEPLYVSTFSEIPAASGLGSSSALTVGLLNALHALKGETVTRQQLAEEACQVEINRLGQPIGKQDQYISAFGGLNQFNFESDGSVTISGLNLNATFLAHLLSSASLFWTGLTRKVEDVLNEQQANFVKGRVHEVNQVQKLVSQFVAILSNAGPVEDLAKIVDQSWALKQKFAHNISNNTINQQYSALMDAGGFGGKLCGGGGGGFILMFHKEGHGAELQKQCRSSFCLPIGMDYSGSAVLVVS